MRLTRTGRHLRRRWWVPALVLLGLVLTACSTESGPKNRQNALRPRGPIAEKIDNLFGPVFYVAVIVGILVLGATIAFAIKFRVRDGEDVRPKQTHGSTPLEIGWTIAPALILLIVAIPTVSTIFSLNEEPKNAVEITVIGKQWWWEFEYPRSEGAPRVVTANEMHIPTGRDVHLRLKACDPSLPGGIELPDGGTTEGCNVIHSFWVPQLGGKRDVVPGRVNELKLKADEDGTYLGQCAEYCGLSHANMRFRVIAESPDEFDAWREGMSDDPAVTLDDAGDAGELFARKFQCGNCHTTEDGSLSTYGPNLTHLASRSTFASGYYELTRERLIDWLLDAPSLVPMESEGCRLPGAPGGQDGVCVGMPSFTKDKPGPKMTRAEAEILADYLLSLE